MGDKSREDLEWEDIGYFDDDVDDCDCSHPDIDILTGEAWCHQCRRKWWLSSEEISREIEFQREYMECVEATATLSESAPNPLQEQRENIGREGK
jgi:hypothetical protein